MITNPNTRLTILLLLLWVTSTMTIALFAVMGASEREGLNHAAYEFATFPVTAANVIGELHSYATGEYKDAHFFARQDNPADLSSFEPVKTAPGIELDGLLIRADAEKIAPGWRLIAGAFKLNGKMENAALLFSPELEVVKAQILEEIGVDHLKPRPKHRKFVHGIAMLDDGSLIYTFDGSVSLQRIDACGSQIWMSPGEFHHAVTLTDNNTLWSLESSSGFVEVDVDTGAIIRTIAIEEIIAANPLIDILELRRWHKDLVESNDRNTVGDWLIEKHHFNDVDPLPAAYADAYPGLSAGDLLISARSLNLVFILDPDTLEIKWWRVGATQRQHDPDWTPSGEIMVFNNRMSRDYSEIIAIDPSTMAVRRIFDGRQNGFYSRIRGKEKLLPNGNIMVTSTQQGRAFEVSNSGDIGFEIINRNTDDDLERYVISEAQWFAPEAVTEPGGLKCAS